MHNNAQQAYVPEIHADGIRYGLVGGWLLNLGIILGFQLVLLPGALPREPRALPRAGIFRPFRAKNIGARSYYFNVKCLK